MHEELTYQAQYITHPSLFQHALTKPGDFCFRRVIKKPNSIMTRHVNKLLASIHAFVLNPPSLWAPVLRRAVACRTSLAVYKGVPDAHPELGFVTCFRFASASAAHHIFDCIHVESLITWLDFLAVVSVQLWLSPPPCLHSEDKPACAPSSQLHHRVPDVITAILSAKPIFPLVHPHG